MAENDQTERVLAVPPELPRAAYRDRSHRTKPPLPLVRETDELLRLGPYGSDDRAH